MDDELLMLDQQMLTEGRRLSGAGAHGGGQNQPETTAALEQ